MNASQIKHQEIVKNLLANKAVDFAAIGKTVAEIGPSRATALEPWDEFCWTMRNFIRLYRHDPGFRNLDRLEELGQAAAEIQR